MTIGAHTGRVRKVIHLPEPEVRPEVEARRKKGADILRPYIGRFVLRKGDEVLFDADNPHEVVAWMREHGVEGAAIFRVPVDPSADMGIHGEDGAQPKGILGDVRELIHLPEPEVRPEVEARRKKGADILRPYIGRYVLQKDDEILFDAETPQEVVRWMRENGAEDAVIFRVPVDPWADMGFHGLA
ncbi:MAG: hypothetical protein ACRD12_11130 [Acidimicrobiales bacterium]